jgi:hypothetical protein
MFPALQARWDVMGLTRDLRRSLLAPADRWRVGADEDGNAMLEKGSNRIVLIPRAARILDSIHLYSDDAEVWLPLVSRLRLRAAARWRLIEHASKTAPKEHASARKAPRRGRKKRARAV